MRPWQARKEKSQKIRKVEGRILYGRDGSFIHMGCLIMGCLEIGNKGRRKMEGVMKGTPSRRSSYEIVPGPPGLGISGETLQCPGDKLTPVRLLT